MFDSIVLNRSIDGPTLTIGEIAEALIFYQNVHIVIDTSTLLGLIREIGNHNVIKLLSLPDIKTTFIEEFVGVYAGDSYNGREYALISAYFSGNEIEGEIKSWKKRLANMVSRQGYSKIESENFVERFKNHVTLKKLASDHFIKGGIIAAARSDLDDSDFVSSAARIIIENLLPKEEIPSDIFYKIHPTRETFQISTNIDFEKINQFNAEKIPTLGETTPSSIAAGILSSSYGLVLAAHYGGDFHTSLTDSKIIQYKNKQLLSRTNTNRNNLNLFHEITLKDCPNISSIINKKERSFEEFLELLAKAKKFKNWLKNKSPDRNLLSDYIDDISKTGWLGNGYGKAIRYIVSTGAGLIDPISGLAISAIDTFLLDKLSAGWKPNQFISARLKPFVDVNDEF
ncbi:hypothetical protein [Enterobacter sp. BIDMC 26]|uniref:hypothetical protein n=1 Tax=Enterobacter sp. BIDMC 26 TaxID=1329838 RepID=UPI00044B27A9|nr:hypothetical protein [Enterobacter sp. BIDMC 26]EUM28828.1 hypothetical protein L462_01487 [Enterobacter sp. BIDMC 26]